MPTLSFGDRKSIGRLSISSINHLELPTETVQQHRSSFVQSTFNAVNVLVGVGILSLPFAFKLSGWFLGIGLLIFFMILTNYTARLIVRCLEYDGYFKLTETPKKRRHSIMSDDSGFQTGTASSSEVYIDESTRSYGTVQPALLPKKLMNYSDVGEAAFGVRGRIFISTLFTMELFAAGIALVILIADSLYALMPQYSLNFFKLVAFIAVTPSLWFRHLHWLSYGSVLGILTIINLIVVILMDGFSKPDRPGSLLEPEVTSFWPRTALRLPSVFGLMMAGFAGHAVFPNIYREMREPEKFGRLLNIAYVSTFVLYVTMASSGYLMFGNLTLDEITKNLAKIPSYDRLLNNLTIWLIAINPATKFALTLQPVAVNLELWMLYCSTAADPYDVIEDETKYAEYHIGSRLFRIRFTPLRIISRTLLSFAVVLIAIVYPGFERIIGLLGSLFSFMVSAVFPLVCYYKLFYDTISSWERVLLVVLIALTGSMATLGTAWSFLPESVIGA